MKLAKLVLCCLLVLACQNSVKADNGLALAYLFGYGGFGGARMQSFAATPPYFAMHPPVYYGERYTRPYGASPFAAWPQLQANSAYAPRPHVDRAHMIPNQYYSYPTSTPAQPGVVQVAPAAPIEIENPFYPSAAVYTSAVE
jgi:hypothetical protein